MRFDWKRFKDKSNKIAVHCKTEKEANNFCRRLNEYGFNWSTGSSYLKNTHYDEYMSDTCYDNTGSFTNYGYYLKLGYEILEWSDYMENEFTKSDLKYGYLVKFRSGETAIFMSSQQGDVFDDMSNCFYIELSDYYNDLISTVSESYDVVAVYGYAEKGFKTTSKDLSERELIWQREPVKEMTIKELEEYFGCKIKIIKED